ncbi:MAG: hypothetical protein OEM82_06540 [Acidobacteriota bacterium]|nr:hypothetical protein [Acidobacteriota bacterium]MDH3528962.1 hypothetical protein [Acidobacteriota bacterium]
MKVFRNAGEELEKRWLAAGYDEAVFPELAAEILESARIHESTTAWELMEWGMTQTELPLQQNLSTSFGDPPITLFNGSRFHIDVYYWIEGTTAIHQHSFCGAFQVFHGSSIHSEYNFETDRELNFFAKTGTLELKACNLLEKGAVQKILPGDQYIHSLFHLDQPSATIVARTTYGALNLPQFSYFKPGYAGDPFFETPVAVRKLQMLSSSIRSGHANADRYLEDYLRNCDFFTAFGTLRSLRPLLRQKSFKEFFGLGETGGRFERFVQIVEEQHPELGDLPKKLFEETLRSEHIVALRNVVSEPEHRFFLALLMNVEGADNVLSLIKERFPKDDPIEKLLDWVSDLANTRVIDNSFSNGLGIEGFTDFDTAVLEGILHGKSADEIESELLSGLSETEEAKNRIRASIKRISESVIFRWLKRNESRLPRRAKSRDSR